MIALAFGLVFNFAMYWYSDKIAIATTRSKPVTEDEYPQLYRIVRELAQERQMPLPRIFVSQMQQPNAFATGRNPEHASVAVTEGILAILDERELRGVLAHELSHVVNRDILIGSIAAAIGMSITFLARFALFFGGGDENRGGGFGVLAAWILAPSRRPSSRWPSHVRVNTRPMNPAPTCRRIPTRSPVPCASSRSRPSMCRRCGR